MQFRTEYNAEPSAPFFDPRKPVVGIGSCFADNITARMGRAMWTAANPAGVLYNPLSILNAVRLFLEDEKADNFRETLFEHRGGWFSWAFDSKMSAPTVDEVVDKFIKARDTFRTMLNEGNKLIVTLGTAWVYYHLVGGVVANCHKMPPSLFTRSRMFPNEVLVALTDLQNVLRIFYHDIQILVTVSPVRHFKDGLVENSVSKSTLLLGVNQFCNGFPHCHYFPAYEIMNDDLRDYRFYAADMVHPNDLAIEYIWEKFLDAHVDAEGREIIKQGEKEWARLHHRPILTWK